MSIFHRLNLNLRAEVSSSIHKRGIITLLYVTDNVLTMFSTDVTSLLSQWGSTVNSNLDFLSLNKIFYKS